MSALRSPALKTRHSRIGQRSRRRAAGRLLDRQAASSKSTISCICHAIAGRVHDLGRAAGATTWTRATCSGHVNEMHPGARAEPVLAGRSPPPRCGTFGPGLTPRSSASLPSGAVRPLTSEERAAVMPGGRMIRTRYLTAALAALIAVGPFAATGSGNEPPAGEPARHQPGPTWPCPGGV